MDFLRNYTIKSRILSLFLLSAIGTLILSYVAISNFNSYNLDSRKATIQAQVDTAESIIKRYYDASIFMGEDEAKRQAMEAIRLMRYSENEYFWVNDLDGVMIMHPMKPQLNGKNVLGVKDPNGVALFQEFVDVAKESGEGFVNYQWQLPGAKEGDAPEDKISFVRLFKPWNMVIGTGAYLNDLKAQTFETIKEFAIVVALIAIPILIIYTLVILSISRPISQIREAVESISHGESDLTVKLPVNGKDEMTDIANGFNAFVNKLRTAIIGVRSASGQNEEKRIVVQGMIENSDSHINSINNDLDSIMAAVTENSATVSEIAENTNRSAEQALLADEATREGYTCVENTMTSIKDMSERFKSTEILIDNLVKNSSEVDQILETITGISDQTNLLALNAAIEAARAGEYGRGFAVVADEVRTLAVKSKDSAESIREILSQLQLNVDSVVSATKESESQCESAERLSVEAGEHLKSITDIIGQITDMSTQIASATSEQESVSSELDQRIIDIAESVKKLSETNVETIVETEEQANSSKHLSSTIEQFKV